MWPSVDHAKSPNEFEPHAANASWNWFFAAWSSIPCVSQSRSERVPVELPVASIESGTLCVEVDEVPSDADPDVAIWTAGARLGVDHLWRPRALAEPPSDEALIPVGGCGCGVFSGHRVGSLLSIVFGCAVARSRRRGGRDVVARGAHGVH